MTQDEALARLYESLTTSPGIREMEPEARAAYMRAAKARSRERQRAAADAGKAEPTAAAIRDALADAALMLLAVDGPGAAQVMAALATAFPGRVGIPMTVQHRARTGSLKPKLIAVPGTGRKSP